MKLWIAAEASRESGIKHGVALSGAVDVEEPAEAQSIAEIHHANACLLFKQTTEACRAQPGMLREFIETGCVVLLLNSPHDFFNGGMHIFNGSCAGFLKILPGGEEGVAQPGVEVSRLILGRDNFFQQGA